MLALDLVRRFGSKTRLPGRYILAEIAAKLFAPKGGILEGHVGIYRVLFDFHNLLQRQMYFELYEQPETQLIHAVLDTGDVFLDVGANIGYYSLLASQIVGAHGQVHAFEPIPQNVVALRRTMLLNGITNIVVNQLAVGARPGSLDLFVSDHEAGSSGWASIVPSRRRSKVVTVERTAIDHYLRSRSISQVSLVKLDIEGGELDAFKGMRSLLGQPHAPDLLCEVNPHLLEKLGRESHDLTRFIAERGYALHRVESSTLKPIGSDQEITKLVNLFCTKAPGRWRHLVSD
jgi:FkbM family methyltransferase